MITVKSQADVFRIPPGTRLTVRWPFNGKTAARTFLRKQGTSAVFATPEGRDTFLNLKGATVTATDGGFSVSWPGDPGSTACEYTFTDAVPAPAQATSNVQPLYGAPMVKQRAEDT
jgi:hypothetical protein